MLYISDNCTNPYFNLAEEEYLLKNFSEPIFRLWQNDNAIIVGRNQNTISEIDSNYVQQNNIAVVRRLSGGGAVYHDKGNLNYTFIENHRTTEDTSAMFARFTSPIIEALNSLGVKAYLEGRNDLLIEGRKFSGNAVAISHGRVLQHGTLLFESNISILSAALKAHPQKFEGKGVKSNISRVTNIKEHLCKKSITEEKQRIAEENEQVAGDNSKREEVSVLWFKKYLGDWVIAHNKDIRQYSLTEEDKRAIEKLVREKYSTAEWNYGESPKYAFSNSARFKGGGVEVYFTVNKGVIESLKICGDYFFTLPTEEFAKALIGTAHTREAITKKISTLNSGAYFNNITSDEIVNLFF